jgi:hypothetical protein
MSRSGRLRIAVALLAAMSLSGVVAQASSAASTPSAHVRHPAIERTSDRRAHALVTREQTKQTLLAAGSVPKAHGAADGTPQIGVNGDVLSWASTPSHTGYVFVEKVPGQPDRYQNLQGTSIQPTPVPGKMVWFSVRVNAPGSSWSPEVAIAYPQAGSTSTPGPNIGRLPFSVGLVAGASADTQLSYLRALGARSARLEFDIDTPAKVVARVCAEYAEAGVRPLILASFNGRLPTPTEARHLATWAAAVGPGGTAWGPGQSANGAAVTDIEFGNETSYTYQFANNSTAAFAARARTYALRFKQAQSAVEAANRHVGMLAIADDAQQGDAWVHNMFKAVPDLGSRVAGWTIHPYGPDWAARIQDMLSATTAAGASSHIPVWITEWGLSSDNGQCISENYGFNDCLTYSSAASTLQSTLTRMRARFGSRIAAFYLFQASDQQVHDRTSNAQGYFGALQSDGTPKGAYTAAVESDLTS